MSYSRKCPKCGSTIIKILTTIELTCNQNYIDETDFSGPFWDNDSDAYCPYINCSFKRKLRDFIC